MRHSQKGETRLPKNDVLNTHTHTHTHTHTEDTHKMALRSWHSGANPFVSVRTDEPTINDDDDDSKNTTPHRSWWGNRGGMWSDWTVNVPLCGGAIVLWLAVAFVFQSAYEASEQNKRVPVSARWATFQEFAQSTPRCAPLTQENASIDSFPLRVDGPRYDVDSYAELVGLVRAPDDDDDWAERVHCAEFRTSRDETTPPACVCLLRTDFVKLVLCSPTIVDFVKVGAVNIWDNWFEDMQPAYVPSEITLVDHCNRDRLVLRNDTAYLAVRAMQFMLREPISQRLFFENLKK